MKMLILPTIIAALIISPYVVADNERNSFLFVTGKASESEYQPTMEKEPNYGLEVGVMPFQRLKTEVVFGYSDLGKYKFGNEEIKMRSFYLATGPKFNLGSFSFNIKVGGHKWRSQVGQIEESGLDPYYSAGLGARVPYFDNIELGIAYEFYKGADQGRDDRKNISATATYYFF